MYDNFSKQCGFVSIKHVISLFIFDKSVKETNKDSYLFFHMEIQNIFHQIPKNTALALKNFEDSRHVTCLIFSYKRFVCVCVHTHTQCYYHTLTQTNAHTNFIFCAACEQGYCFCLIYAFFPQSINGLIIFLCVHYF